MSTTKTEQVLAMYRDIDKIAQYLRIRHDDLLDHYPHLSRESRQIFLYEVVARIIDILEERLELPRSQVIDLILDNDEYNRYQRIKAINLQR